MKTKERPILFSAPMVRAILDGKKTQTRRVVKYKHPATIMEDESGKPWPHFDCYVYGTDDPVKAKCPYGQVGDVLWVRECFYQFGHWEPVPGVKTKTGRMKWKFIADSNQILDADNPPESYRKGRHHKDPETKAWHKRLGRFMPRWASRIDLKITGVRVEHLQEISHDDANTEGVQVWIDSFKSSGSYHQNGQLQAYPVTAFARMWDEINGSTHPWEANPYVWVVEFERLEKGE